MLCSEVMKRNVECISAQTSARDAARKMRDQNIGFLPVCDESMRALGSVTDRDIAIRVVAEDRPLTMPVESVMTRDVVACRPEDDLSYARELMAQHRKSRIMCIDREGHIEGVISLSDLVQLDESSGASTLREVSAREVRKHDGESRPLLS